MNEYPKLKILALLFGCRREGDIVSCSQIFVWKVKFRTRHQGSLRATLEHLTRPGAPSKRQPHLVQLLDICTSCSAWPCRLSFTFHGSCDTCNTLRRRFSSAALRSARPYAQTSSISQSSMEAFTASKQEHKADHIGGFSKRSFGNGNPRQ